jgi:hypothetical protein
MIPGGKLGTYKLLSYLSYRRGAVATCEQHSPERGYEPDEAR